MPGRFANQVPAMPDWSGLLKIWPDITYGYNISPGDSIAAFRSPAGKAMRWGLIPHWSKSFTSEFATFKAQLESVPDKPAFRDAWEHKQRCLIPMLGYYEWTGEKGNKQPYFVRAAAGDGLVVAGLYDKWGSEGLYSCTMLTRPADAELTAIHPRMPVLLNPEAAATWLHGDPADARQFLLEIARPELEYYPVSKEVGNALANGKRLTEKIQIDD